MRILDEKGLSGIVKRFLDLTFFGGIAIIVALPFLLKWYLDMFRGSIAEKYWFLLPFFYFTGVLALIILNELRRIFGTLNRRDPFVMQNVKSLKNMALSAFAISALYVVKVVFFNSFLTVIMAMVFIIAGFFGIILAEVFRQAVIVKEENDLTI
jgi:hypothetical protein